MYIVTYNGFEIWSWYQWCGGVRRGAHQGLNLYYMIYEQPLETFKHQQDIYLINVSISGRSKKSSASTFPISSVSLVSDFCSSLGAFEGLREHILFLLPESSDSVSPIFSASIRLNTKDYSVISTEISTSFPGQMLLWTGVLHLLFRKFKTWIENIYE